MSSSSALEERPKKQDSLQKRQQSNAATGASAAGIRAVSAQFITFYFRAPVKAFFRARVDYMAYARAIHPRVQAGDPWSWHISTPGLVAHAVRTHGWGFIPNQILPPMLANVSIGAILYTTYLQALGVFHEPSSRASGRTYPPPTVGQTFAAGFAAGSVQSVFAAPLDALQVRFRTNEMLEGRYRSMWHYAYHKLGAIGLRGVFAGWSLSFLKDSWSYALFFSAFEFVKAQAYYAALPGIYKAERDAPQPIHPHYLIEPFFILSAGVLASVAQQGVQHPITQLQNVHFNRLESLDYVAKLEKSHRSMMRLYYHAYLTTFDQARRQARLAGGWRRWLYKDFLWNTIKMTPSTSAGLIVFEIVRRRYAGGIGDGGAVRLDGMDFVL